MTCPRIEHEFFADDVRTATERKRRYCDISGWGLSSEIGDGLSFPLPHKP
jgi:hypothetical protein